MIRSARSVRVVGAISLLILGGACSSTSQSRSAEPTTGSRTSDSTGTGSTQPQGAPIKVGLICACSGGSFGQNIVPGVDNYKAWANTVNATGGINGHPVQVIVEDDAANPGLSLNDAQTLVNSDHVVAIEDDTIVDQSWATFAQSANVPVIGLTNYNPDFYPIAQTNDSVVDAVVETVKAAGAKNFASMYCAEAPTCQQSVPLLKAAGQKLGVPDILNSEVAAAAPNYTAQCVAAEQAHAQALFVADSSNVIERVAQDCANQSYHPIYVTEGLGFSLLLDSAPGLNNLWSEYLALPFWASAPAVQAMNAAMDKYYPGVRGNKTSWSENPALTWPGGLLLEDAIKAGGLSSTDTPTAAEVTRGLGSLKGDTLDGWSPPLTFVPGQVHTVDCWYTARVENGTPSLANGGKPTCQSGASS